MTVYDYEKFEPIAKVGENLILIPPSSYCVDNNGRLVFYKITFIEPLPEIIKDFGAVSASSSVTDQEVTELYVYDNQLAQYRIYPISDVQIKVKQPKASTRYATKNTVSYISKFTKPDNLREIFIFSDKNATYFDIINPRAEALSESLVRFVGWKFILAPIIVDSLQQLPKTYTVVPLETARTINSDPITFFIERLRGGR